MQRVLITGANRGIGLEFTKHFLERGEQVFAVVRKAGSLVLPKLVEIYPGQLSVLSLDVSHSDEFENFTAALLNHTEALDLLIHNAGVLPAGERFGAVQANDLIDTFKVNAVAPLLLTQALLPLLMRGRQAKVIMISTELASIANRKAFATPSYSISKAALNMAMRLLAFELSARDIGCMAVHPGWVKTDMGGSNAPVDAEDAVRAMVALMDRFMPAQQGGFFSSDGQTIPW